MRKQLILGILFLIGLTFNTLQSQNLVLNPSFENYNNCPNTIGQLNVLEDWYSLNDGDPDYFNSCTISPVIDVPGNAYGNQAPASGDGYAGFIAFGEDEAREYVSVPLSSPMVIGQSYCVDFKVSLSDANVYGIQDIGALFTTTMVQVSNGGTVYEATPQVLHTDSLIIDTENWVTISAVITADQAYNYVHIGNFFTNANTTGGGTFIGAPDIKESFYYLDDVSVQALATELLNIPEMQQICAGDEVNFTAVNGNSGTFQWYSADNPNLILSNTASLSQEVFETTTFIVAANLGSCSLTDTVFVETVPIPDVDFVAQGACVNQGTMLVDLSNDVLPGASYEWDVNNDGTIEATTAGEASIVFETAGSYTVSLTIYNNEFCFRELQQTIFVTEDCDPCDDPFNYAPNPGFESFEACPDSLSLEGFISDWTQPTGGTSDFFHTCAEEEDPLNFPGVPTNTFGIQDPLSGNGYAGFFAYRDVNFNYREYISAQLVEPMMAGQSYCVSFNVSLADVGFAIEEIGAYFSNGSVDTSDSYVGVLDFVPQIENTNGPITDSNNWVTITGTFTPQETLNWITIGNFNDNDNTTVVNGPGSDITDLNQIAYYYLDDLSISTVPMTNFDSNGYGICEGESFTLTAPEGFCEYAWYPVNEPNNILSTGTQLSYTPTDLGSLEIAFEGGKNNCSVVETFVLNTNTAPIADFTFEAGCFQEVVAFVNLSENTGSETIYQWDFTGNGAIDQVSGGSIGHFYSQAGSYNVTLTAINPGGCSTSITKTVAVSAECDPCAPANLLFNPSFEFINGCPTELGDIEQAIDWFSPTDDPADFFNACGVDGLTGVPNNNYGTLPAFEGVGYAGLVAYVENDEYREYISTELPTPLVVGQQYCIGFKVHISPSSGFAIDRLGAYFTEDSFIPVNTAMPQAVNEAFDIIFQPGWVEVSAVFTADQPYGYLTLGNFFDIANPELNALDIPSGPNNDTAYYYIDNVSLVATDLEITSTATNTCQGDNVTISANTSLCEHQWTVLGDTVVLGNNTSINVNPNTTTTYLYTGSNLACEAITQEYTINVSSTPDAGIDLFLCPDGTGVTLTELNGGATSYNWSPATDLNNPFIQSPVASPEETTTYILQVDYGEPTPCPTTDTVTVYVINSFSEVNTPVQDTACAGIPYQLSVGGGISYHWEPAELFNNPDIANPTVTLTETTNIIVDIENIEGSCHELETITLTVVDCDLGGPDWVDENNNSINNLCESVFRNDTLVLPLPQIIDPDFPQNDNLSITFIPPSNGTATVDPDELVYIPDTNYSGQDTMYVIVCDQAFPVQCDTLLICLTVINEPPQFASDNLCLGVNQGDNIEHCFNVADDFTAYEDLSFQILPIDPITGQAIITNNNCLNYTASDTGNGDAFMVIACDPDGACDTLDIQVFNFPENVPPIAEDFSEATLQGLPITFCLDITDPNTNDGWGEVTNASLLNTPINGTFELAPEEDCFIYTPNIDFIGTEFISFTICDDGLDFVADFGDVCDTLVSYTESGEPLCTTTIVTILVEDGLAANDDFSQVEDNQLNIFNILENDVPSNPEEVNLVQIPAHGNVVLNNDGTISYIPNEGYLGPDSIVYSICVQPLGCDTATWYIDVVNSIDAMDDEITTIEDDPLTVPVLGNDFYPELENLEINIVQAPANGTVSINTDGGISYFPDEDFSGVDTFIYEICNPGVGCDQAVVTVNVVDALPPTLQNDFVNTEVGLPTVIDFLSNDSDPLGDTLIVKGFDDPNNGTIAFDSLGLLLDYDPNDGFFGNDTITYTVCNSNGLTSSAIIVVTVNAPDCELTIPGGFSPNNDSKNDLFEIQELTSCVEYQENEMIIFNRWGSQVYSKANYGSDGNWWNGTWDNNQEDLPEGTYFYLIKTFYQGNTETFKGSVEVFR